jgi:hypothetical protein
MPPRAVCPYFAAALTSVALLVGACSTSSSTPCAPQGTVTVQVTDEDVDNPANYLCGAMVTIRSGGGAPTALAAQGVDGSDVECAYTINAGPGSYTLTASANGYTTLSEPLVITQVGCVTGSPSVHMGLFQTNMGEQDGGLPDVNVFRTQDGGGDAGVDATTAADAGHDGGHMPGDAHELKDAHEPKDATHTKDASHADAHPKDASHPEDTSHPKDAHHPKDSSHAG